MEDRWNTLLIAEILDVHVGTQSGVVAQIPSVVIGIVVDHNRIGVPEPIVTEGNVVWGHTEEESVEPETSRAAPGEPEDVTASDASGETTMLERMIDRIVAVAASRVMSNPVTVAIDVRRIGMSGTIAERRMVSVSVLFRLTLDRVGTMRWHVATADRATGGAGSVPATGVTTATLRKHGDRTDDHNPENTYVLFHYCLQGKLSTLNQSKGNREAIGPI
jgi:hypothetical protein